MRPHPPDPVLLSPGPSIAATAQDPVPEIPPEPAPPPGPAKKPSARSLAPMPIELEPSSSPTPGPPTQSASAASGPAKPHLDDRTANGGARLDAGCRCVEN